MTNDPISDHFKASMNGLAVAAADPVLLALARDVAEMIADALRNDRKVLLIGNGGSAADAQHIAAELVGRYKKERRGYAALALTTDTSALTAIGNDYGIEQMFARQVQGLGQRGDVLIALTTSGRSSNIIAAVERAREGGLKTIVFTGVKGVSLNALCDHLFIAPSNDTPVIQQIHMTALHAICDHVERALTADQ